MTTEAIRLSCNMLQRPRGDGLRRIPRRRENGLTTAKLDVNVIYIHN
jgi:hypothetical protein